MGSINTSDVRVIKTRNNIESTFLRLLAGEHFEEITVQRIIKEALISKGTFYAHYSDKYDLAAIVGRKVIAQFQEGIRFRLRGILFSADYGALMASLAKDMEAVLPNIYHLKRLPEDVFPVHDEVIRALRTEFDMYFREQKKSEDDNYTLRLDVVTKICIDFFEYIYELQKTVTVSIDYWQESIRFMEAVYEFSEGYIHNIRR